MDFTAIKKDGKLNFDDPQGWHKYISALKEEQRLVICVKKCGDPKTSAQLGYYYGLLLPEITKELKAQGITRQFNFFGLEINKPYSQDETHELLKQLCGSLFRGGRKLDVKDMDEITMRDWLDWVLNFASDSLKMNYEALLAKRPERPKSLFE